MSVMFPIFLAVILFPVLCSSQALPFQVCTLETSFPHQGVPIPFSPSSPTTVPVTIYYPCTPSGNPISSSPKSVIPIVPAGLARSSDYSSLASALAKRGFVVAVTQYDQRDIQRINVFTPFYEGVKKALDDAIANGYDCPPNGQTPSVKLWASLLSFIAGDALPTHIRSLYNTDRVVLFGHSFAGSLAESLFTDACVPVQDPVDPPPPDIGAQELTFQFLARSGCEQFNPDTDLPTDLTVRGVVTWEGFSPVSQIPVTEDRFWVVLHSPFYDTNVADFFGGRDFGDKVGIVRFTTGNHYGPANFVTENNNQRPVCMRERAPPEDMFTITETMQNQLIDSIAESIEAAWKGFNKLEKLPRKRPMDIDSVDII